MVIDLRSNSSGRCRRDAVHKIDARASLPFTHQPGRQIYSSVSSYAAQNSQAGIVGGRARPAASRIVQPLVNAWRLLGLLQRPQGKWFDPSLAHQSFIPYRDGLQVAESRRGCGGSNKILAIERDSFREEQLLEPLALVQ